VSIEDDCFGGDAETNVRDACATHTGSLRVQSGPPTPATADHRSLTTATDSGVDAELGVPVVAE
jgi:hypothetical protein